jgi:serine/threonine protein phosphatase 1
VIYAVGDVHGCWDKLSRLLDLISESFDPDRDQLVFLGDYIDRGRLSRQVIDRLLEIREELPETVFLRGNHEQLMLTGRDLSVPSEHRAGVREKWAQAGLHLGDIWLSQGGRETLMSYMGDDYYEGLREWWTWVPDEHWEFLEETELEFQTERFHFVHAGICPQGYRWEADLVAEDPRLWIREPFIESRQDFGRVVVFGHTPMTQPLIESNKLGIDTGAVFGGKLTCAVLDDETPYVPGAVTILQA